MVDEGMDVVKHTVGEPIVADELPDVFLWVQLGAFRWQRNDGDVVRHDELAREVPSGLIGQQQCMTSWGHVGGDRREMQVHQSRYCTTAGSSRRPCPAWDRWRRRCRSRR